MIVTSVCLATKYFPPVSLTFRSALCMEMKMQIFELLVELYLVVRFRISI